MTRASEVSDAAGANAPAVAFAARSTTSGSRKTASLRVTSAGIFARRSVASRIASSSGETSWPAISRHSFSRSSITSSASHRQRAWRSPPPMSETFASRLTSVSCAARAALPPVVKPMSAAAPTMSRRRFDHSASSSSGMSAMRVNCSSLP